MASNKRTTRNTTAPATTAPATTAPATPATPATALAVQFAPSAGALALQAMRQQANPTYTAPVRGVRAAPLPVATGGPTYTLANPNACPYRPGTMRAQFWPVMVQYNGGNPAQCTAAVAIISAHFMRSQHAAGVLVLRNAQGQVAQVGPAPSFKLLGWAS
jgi:hypothetical protein